MLLLLLYCKTRSIFLFFCWLLSEIKVRQVVDYKQGVTNCWIEEFSGNLDTLSKNFYFMKVETKVFGNYLLSLRKTRKSLSGESIHLRQTETFIYPKQFRQAALFSSQFYTILSVIYYQISPSPLCELSLEQTKSKG